MLWLKRADTDKESAYSCWLTEALFGWLYEIFVQEEFLRGGNFAVRVLDAEAVEELSIVPTVGHFERFKRSFSFEDVIMDADRIPESSWQPWIDSYMITDSGLLIFQIPIQAKHPVKASELVDLLNRLQILESVKADPAYAKIIFVVPQGEGSQYRKQEIANGVVQCDVEHADCTIVSGIGPIKKEELAKLGIRSCKDLLSAYENGDGRINFVREAVEDFTKLIAIPIDLTFLSLIPQYVLEMSYSNTFPARRYLSRNRWQ